MRKALSLSLLIATCLLCSAVAAPPGSSLNQEQLRALFNQNFARFRQFRCHEPQQRSVQVRELMLREGRIQPSDSVMPAATVLHVCGPSTGCCSNIYKVCAPVANETVTLPFSVSDTVLGSEYVEINFSFVNHTRCGCVSKSDAASS